jgi:predicted metalloprotease
MAAPLSLLLLTAGCADDPGVLTESARRTVSGAVEPPPTSGPPPVTAPPTTGAPSPTTPPVTDPAAPTTPPVPPASTPAAPPSSGDVLDLGDAKTPRDYDDFLAAALADLHQWWTEQYPALYSDPFEPLGGGVYAAYPERTDPIPGCGTSDPTTYEEIREYSAFYCQQGDFMVYDDGEDGVLYGLADEFGPPILGVVLAHEFGHAIQARTGDLARGLPTITTEQQADCMAGAWVARAASGAAAGITFTDADVRTGLIAMITVRDPVGLDQFSEGGHGSAFDRVGAFQVGFTSGLQRCAELIDDPLPLVPNTFRRGSNPEGNAAFGYGEREIVGLIITDLNAFWPLALSTIDATLPQLSVVPIESADEISCAQPGGDFGTGAVYCSDTNQVFFDEPLARDLYDRFGDFVVGYMLGGAWSEAAQQALGSPLSGEDRSLLSDCLTGTWVADIIPDESGNTSRGAAVVEPGDLDEAIQTALVVGDASSSDDVVGSGFEKIASFREGVLGGIDACNARLGD